MTSYQNLPIGSTFPDSPNSSPFTLTADASSSKKKSFFLKTLTFSLFLGCVITLLPKFYDNTAPPPDAPIADTDLLGSHLEKKLAREQAAVCTDENYSKETLKLTTSTTFSSLFTSLPGHTKRKFEASDIITLDGFYYSVHDNLWEILRISTNLNPGGKHAMIPGDTERREGEDSGYEAIFWDSKRESLFLVRESVKHHKDGSRVAKSEDLTDSPVVKPKYKAIIEEVRLPPVPLTLAREAPSTHSLPYTVKNRCSTEFEFSGESKGFEGAVGLRDDNDNLFMLGLCEGNNCEEGSEGKDRGHGKIVVMRLEMFDKKEKEDANADAIGVAHECMWVTVRVVDLPSSVNFMDYSAIAVSPKGKVAITSQEDSQVWIGHLVEGDKPEDFNAGEEDGTKLQLDINTFSFTEGKLYNFPRADNSECSKKLCNVEGIHFLNGDKDDEQLLAASDKMKKGGKQEWRCGEFDQSMHIFDFP